MTETGDKSLLRCTIKKSVDIFTKVLLYGLYSAVIIVLITAIAAVGYLIWLGFNSLLATVIYSSIISLLVSIPWYGYAGVMAALAIPVYSFLWCIAKRLTESDWSSGAAKETATFISISIVVVALAVIAIALGMLHDSYPIPSLPGYVILSLALLSLGFTMFLSDSKWFLFCGAHSNYRKRIKNGEKE